MARHREMPRLFYVHGRAFICERRRHALPRAPHREGPLPATEDEAGDVQRVRTSAAEVHVPNGTQVPDGDELASLLTLYSGQSFVEGGLPNFLFDVDRCDASLCESCV